MVGVPEAEDDADGSGDGLEAVVDAGDAARREREGQADEGGHQEHAEDGAETEDGEVEQPARG